MDFTYFMIGLGLDIPIIHALVERAPATLALREFVSFLLDTGFSLVSEENSESHIILKFKRYVNENRVIVADILYNRNTSYFSADVSYHSTRYFHLEINKIVILRIQNLRYHNPDDSDIMEIVKDLILLN